MDLNLPQVAWHSRAGHCVVKCLLKGLKTPVAIAEFSVLYLQLQVH